MMSTFPSKATTADVNGAVSPEWPKAVRQEEVCQRATKWRRLVEGVVEAAREKGSAARTLLPVQVRPPKTVQ